jgi:hypothetical protein
MQILKEKKNRVFPVFVLVTLLVQGGILLTTMFELILTHRLASRPTPNLVQLIDGRAVKVAPQAYLAREPETIRRFVNETMTLMFSWSGTLPPATVEEAKSPQPDPGIEVQTKDKKSAKVATATWEASFALSEEFRKPFVLKLAELTPNTIFQGQGSQGLLVIRRISDPQVVEPGTWKVALIANLILFNRQDQVGNAISFNKEIFVRSVEPPALPLEEQSSGLEQIVYRIRQSGLEIYAIRDLPREDLKQ